MLGRDLIDTVIPPAYPRGPLSGDEFAILLAKTHELDGIEVRMASASPAPPERCPTVVGQHRRAEPTKACPSPSLRADRPRDIRREIQETTSRLAHTRPRTDDDGAMTSGPLLVPVLSSKGQ